MRKKCGNHKSNFRYIRIHLKLIENHFRLAKYALPEETLSNYTSINAPKIPVMAIILLG